MTKVPPALAVAAPGDIGLLLPKQRAWVADPAAVKIAEKGRRTGFTFGEAILRDAKGALAPPLETLARLPELLAKPKAILWDNETQNLVYVVEASGDQGTRFVVSIQRAEKARDAAGRDVTIRTNSVINGQVINVQALVNRRRFQVIDGEP